MATRPTTSIDVTRRRPGIRARRAIVASVALIVLVGVVGSTSVADVLVHITAVGTGIGIAAICCVGWYLICRAALDGASRQFGHAWRNRRA